MKEIIEKLKEAIAANRVDPVEIANAIPTLIPRILSFNHTNDSGYVTGNVIAWWIAEERVVFKAGLPNMKAWYKLDALHTVLPTAARIGIRKAGGNNVGFLRFDVGGTAAVAEFTEDLFVEAGESVEFYVELLGGISAVTVSLPHWLAPV